jgi:hypothetical protein
MAVQTFLPMATRSNTTITAGPFDPPPSVNSIFVVLVPANGWMDTPDQTLQLVIEREVDGQWVHLLGGDPWVGGGSVGRGGMAVEVTIGRDFTERLRGRIVVGGTVRFRVDGEIRRGGQG